VRLKLATDDRTEALRRGLAVARVIVHAQEGNHGKKRKR
jgi:hypothetical protein